jgi:hypothetical protein
VLIVILIPGAPWQAAEKTFGEGVRLEEATPVASILADPQAWDGKRVRVEGQVTGVCPMKGCWIRLGSEEGTLQIKVEDDVIVFPREAEGGYAIAEGVVRVVTMDRDQFVQWKSHEAEELGVPFDPESVGEGPFVRVLIESDGAAIRGENL